MTDAQDSDEGDGSMTTIWIRAEEKAREARAPVSPVDAATLLSAGYDVAVEASPARAIPDADYAAAGCRMVETGSWRTAPADAIILGVKELPLDGPLSHRHIHFGHVFKDQTGWREDLSRFRDGGGALYDLEFLFDDNGRRVAAFGYWAGYAGAALGLMLWAGLADGKAPPLSAIEPVSGCDELVARTLKALDGRRPTALITGALGRCGRGATDMLTAAGIDPTRWDIAETAHGGPFPEIIGHDLFVNCVLAGPGIPVFVPRQALPTLARRLTAIADVSCDPSSDYNPVPVYDHTTTFDDPAVMVATQGQPMAVTAIDHLPSLLPIESTMDYSAQLTPSLLTLDQLDEGVWGRAKATFEAAVARI